LFDLAACSQRLGLHGRVTGSHLTSMPSMDNAYVAKLIKLITLITLITLIHETGVSVVAIRRRRCHPLARSVTFTHPQR